VFLFILNWSDLTYKLSFAFQRDSLANSRLFLLLTHPKTHVKWVLRLERSYECQTHPDWGVMQERPQTKTKNPSNYFVILPRNEKIKVQVKIQITRCYKYYI